MDPQNLSSSAASESKNIFDDTLGLHHTCSVVLAHYIIYITVSHDRKKSDTKHYIRQVAPYAQTSEKKVDRWVGRQADR